jgi:hypothetical protein
MVTHQGSNERCALEAIEHLQKKICLMWGSPELDVFISRLIMDSRDGQRQGLPMAIGAELLFLAQINKIIRAIALLGKQNVNLKEAYRLVDEGDQKRLEADAFDNPLVSRDTIVRKSEAERRSGRERRIETKPSGAVASFGHLVFKLIFSKIALFLIAAALTAKLFWPLLSKAAG